ncbi:MAG: hypothetical protein GC188_10905 [Alphaproteobacteria bacterium]|nr:hypothetical protein [Alphaproteobacteria bacterium]
MDLTAIAESSNAHPEDISAIARDLSSLTLDVERPENSWQLWLWYRDRAESEQAACLFSLVAQEQYVRGWFMNAYSPGNSDPVDEQEMALMGGFMTPLDMRNRQWLRAVVAEQGWFRISEYGEGADQAAFLIVQHADHDVAFQREMLALLSELVEAGETRPSGFALLTDRVAVNSGEMQTYGSQGRCTGLRQWEARPYSGTFEEMDARRESVGLEHHAAYVSRMAENYCSTDRDY